jgi:hypothetical protein
MPFRVKYAMRCTDSHALRLCFKLVSDVKDMLNCSIDMGSASASSYDTNARNFN